MALLDDLSAAVTNALKAGADAARAQGAELANDFNTLVKPNLDSVVVAVASITEKRIAQQIGDDEARDLMGLAFDQVGTLILAMVELAELALQTIVNAVLASLKSVVNDATTRAIGVALFV